jgi:RIO kinase 1
VGKNKDNEQLAALEELIDNGTLDDVLGVVKSGKEATVYCCRATERHGGALVAAKVYRSRDVRRFANDTAYRGGRDRNYERRVARAVRAGTTFGRDAAFGRWVADEYETLRLLYAAGADVPAPLARSEAIVVMEYIGDEDEPGAPLASVRLEGDEAKRIFGRLMRNIELALANDRIHGDLSPFNVLYFEGDVRIIDFPQAVDPRFNEAALSLLDRDVENICRYFERSGVVADAHAISRGMWGRFLRSEL